MRKFEKKKTNNKGFSLVELIIVIAIMAVLIGVLAPQYLKYVERSRKSTDKQNVEAIVNALGVYAIDPEVATADQITTGAVITLTTTSTSVTATNATNNTNRALTAAGINKIGLKSSDWGASGAGGTVTLTVTITNGIIDVTSSDATIME